MQIRFDPNNILGHLTDTKSVIDNTLETYNKFALETDSSFITAVPDNIKNNIRNIIQILNELANLDSPAGNLDQLAYLDHPYLDSLDSFINNVEHTPVLYDIINRKDYLDVADAEILFSPHLKGSLSLIGSSLYRALIARSNGVDQTFSLIKTFIGKCIAKVETDEVLFNQIAPITYDKHNDNQILADGVLPFILSSPRENDETVPAKELIESLTEIPSIISQAKKISKLATRNAYADFKNDLLTLAEYTTALVRLLNTTNRITKTTMYYIIEQLGIATYNSVLYNTLLYIKFHYFKTIQDLLDKSIKAELKYTPMEVTDGSLN